MGKVLTVSRDELETRRAELLDSVGTSLDELVERAQAGELRDREWSIWTELCELQYLLGEDVAWPLR